MFVSTCDRRSRSDFVYTRQSRAPVTWEPFAVLKHGWLHKPSARRAGERAGAVFKEKTALFPMDDDGITVQRVFFVERTEGTDVINGETAPVRPGDGPGLHIAGGIKVGSDSYINAVRPDTDVLSILFSVS